MYFIRILRAIFVFTKRAWYKNNSWCAYGYFRERDVWGWKGKTKRVSEKGIGKWTFDESTVARTETLAVSLLTYGYWWPPAMRLGLVSPSSRIIRYHRLTITHSTNRMDISCNGTDLKTPISLLINCYFFHIS